VEGSMKGVEEETKLNCGWESRETGGLFWDESI
jgi:hypothetical protein